VRSIALLFLYSRSYTGVGGERQAPAVLAPGKRSSTRCTGGWVSPRASLDGCGNPRPNWD